MDSQLCSFLFCAQLWLHGQRWAVPPGSVFVYHCSLWRNKKGWISESTQVELTFWQENKKKRKPCSSCVDCFLFHTVKELEGMAAGKQRITEIETGSDKLWIHRLSQGDGNNYLCAWAAGQWIRRLFGWVGELVKSHSDWIFPLPHPAWLFFFN